ncbi:hypothetical protein GCM10023200_11250 [Actinomycetospora chlora]|uniref:Cation diffusion facilitator CzcD-associated flavoprotein CzcO n=1 Tax=Actinomycetospora chlora TaxID=663608 RepID=A0ABP9AEJ0_9PSEU
MPDTAEPLDAVVVGAGWTGLAVLHLLRGRGLRVRAYDTAGNVGGTWWWHAFPGSHLDVDSALYQYFFDEDLYREWGWSERYPAGYEVQRWFRFAADRLGLRRDVRLSTTVTDATRDADGWTLRTDRGEVVRTRALVACTGRGSVEPDVDVSAFGGLVLRTASWREDRHDLRGRRVGVLGSGTSAIQLVPAVVDAVAALTVVADRPRDVVPRVNPLYGWPEREAYRARFAELRDAPHDPPPAPDRDGMRARLPAEPRLATLLVPDGEPDGVVRDGGWLEAFTCPHVELLAAGDLARVGPDGLELADGSARPLDMLVVADQPDAGPPASGRFGPDVLTPTRTPPGTAPCVHLYREAHRLADEVAAALPDDRPTTGAPTCASPR